MHIQSYRQSWTVNETETLRTALAWRDQRNGAEFWLWCGEEIKHPSLAIRISGNIADVHYFPKKGHAGFRRLGGQGLSPNGSSKLIYMGCDPGEGEEIPNKFVIPSEEAAKIAEEFFESGCISHSTGWLEL